MAAPTTMECEDFLGFQETLKKMRVLDDKIVYALNTSIPTESFKGQVNASNTCKHLYDQDQYSQREVAIKKCILVVGENVDKLKNQKEFSLKNDKTLKKERTKLRLLQSELNVEEVVREQTLKVFYERCRTFYKPPTLQV